MRKPPAGRPPDSAALQEFLRKQSHGEIPFWQLLAMEIREAGAGRAVVRIPYRRELTNSYGTVHGGALFAAADSAAAVALMSLLKEGERIATTEMKINFIRPADRMDILAEALILHRGSRTAVAEVTVREAAGAGVVAKALGTYAIAKSATGQAK
jgi:uncharacterized protein (TIGR00369 family)